VRAVAGGASVALILKMPAPKSHLRKETTSVTNHDARGAGIGCRVVVVRVALYDCIAIINLGRAPQ
jgi:hypothetical protein